MGEGGIREHMLCTLFFFFSPTTDSGAVREILLKILKENHTHRLLGGHRNVHGTHTHISWFFKGVKPSIHHRPAQGSSEAEVTLSPPFHFLTLGKVWSVCRHVQMGLGLQSVLQAGKLEKKLEVLEQEPECA